MENIPDSIYKEAWAVLYNCLGERCQDEELELMDSVLQYEMSDEQRKNKCIKPDGEPGTKG